MIFKKLRGECTPHNLPYENRNVSKSLRYIKVMKDSSFNKRVYPEEWDVLGCNTYIHMYYNHSTTPLKKPSIGSKGWCITVVIQDNNCNTVVIQNKKWEEYQNQFQ